MEILPHQSAAVESEGVAEPVGRSACRWAVAAAGGKNIEALI